MGTLDITKPSTYYVGRVGGISTNINNVKNGIYK